MLPRRITVQALLVGRNCAMLTAYQNRPIRGARGT